MQDKKKNLQNKTENKTSDCNGSTGCFFYHSPSSYDVVFVQIVHFFDKVLPECISTVALKGKPHQQILPFRNVSPSHIFSIPAELMSESVMSLSCNCFLARG